MTGIDRISSDAIRSYEERYLGLEFTDRERVLLTTENLAVLNLQRRFILLSALSLCECPVCHIDVCRRSACTASFDTDDSLPDNAYACPGCDTKLTWHVALLGGFQWFSIQPGQTVTIRPFPGGTPQGETDGHT